METAIIGLTMAGKTTLFNALTGRAADTSAFGGKRGAINLADVPVPDDRVNQLSALFSPKKTTFASVQLKDIQAELTPDGGIESRTIAELRNADAIAIVVRAYNDEAIPHPLDSIDPLRDFNSLIDSLVFSDFAVVDRRLERLAKEGRHSDLETVRLERVRDRLEEGLPLGSGFLTDQDRTLLSGFAFLTSKPVVVVVNTGDDTTETEPLREAAERSGLPILGIHGRAEMEIAQLSPEDQKEFLEDAGLADSARDRFLRTIYAHLDLISFITAGEDEVRAWSIRRETKAPRAAGKIHSDLEKGFIRAEVVRWDDLLQAGGFKESKSNATTRVEGKDYLVQDGDVITVLFNV